VNLLETFVILFETSAQKAQTDATAAVDKIAGDTERADERIKSSNKKRTLEELENIKKVANAELAAALQAPQGEGGAAAWRANLDAKAEALRKVRAEIERVKRGEAEGAQATRDHARALDQSTVAADRLAGGFGRLIGRGVALVASYLSVQAVLGGIRRTYAEINALTEQADRLGFGENVEGLNAVNQVLEDVGGSAEKAQRNLRTFADQIGEAFGDAESKAGKALAGIGVSVADANGDLKDTETVMLEIAAALEGVSKAKGAAALSDLGLKDPALRALLMGGRASLEARFGGERAKGLITNEDARAVREYKLAWDDAKDAVQGFFNSMLAGWAPTLTRFANRLENFVMWLREHASFVQGLGIGVVTVLGTIAAFMWATYIPAWAAAAVAMVAAAWPFLVAGALIIGAIAAIALAWDDVQNYLKGNSSLLGELVEKYNWVGDVIAALSGQWAQTSALFKEDMAAIRAGAKWLGDVFVAVWDAITAGARATGEVFVNIAKAIMGDWGPLLSMIFGAVAKLGGGGKGGFQAAADWGPRNPGLAMPAGVAAGLTAGQRQIGAAANNRMASATSASVAGARTSNRQTSVKIDKLEVVTQATDAAGIAKAASGALSFEIRRTAGQWDDGVER